MNALSGWISDHKIAAIGLVVLVVLVAFVGWQTAPFVDALLFSKQVPLQSVSGGDVNETQLVGNAELYPENTSHARQLNTTETKTYREFSGRKIQQHYRYAWTGPDRYNHTLRRTERDGYLDAAEIERIRIHQNDTGRLTYKSGQRQNSSQKSRTYDRNPGVAVELHPISSYDGLDSLKSVELKPVGQWTANGNTVTRLRIVGVEHRFDCDCPGTYAGKNTALLDATGFVDVSETGTVVRGDLTYRYLDDGVDFLWYRSDSNGIGTYHLDWEWSATETVSPPGWQSKTLDVDHERVDDDTVALTNTGRNAVPANAEVTVSSNESRTLSTTIPDELSPSDTIYLTVKPTEHSAELVASGENRDYDADARHFPPEEELPVGVYAELHRDGRPDVRLVYGSLA